MTNNVTVKHLINALWDYEPETPVYYISSDGTAKNIYLTAGVMEDGKFVDATDMEDYAKIRDELVLGIVTNMYYSNTMTGVIGGDRDA